MSQYMPLVARRAAVTVRCAMVGHICSLDGAFTDRLLLAVRNVMHWLLICMGDLGTHCYTHQSPSV